MAAKGKKIISHQFESHIICYEALNEAQMRLSKYYQWPDETNTSLLKTFNNLVEVYEHYGGVLNANETAKKYERDKDLQNRAFKNGVVYCEEAKERMLVIAMLRRADRTQYGPYITHLRNQYL